MESTSPEQNLASDAAEASLAEYRALNPSPYVVLVLGLLAAASLISPIFFPLGLAAVVVGLWTSTQEDDSTTDTARLANGIGIALGLFFLSLLAARQFSRNWSIQQEADVFASGWFDLLRQGDVERAHQLSLPPQDRQVPETDLKKFYQENTEARTGRDHFYLTPPLSKVVRGIKEGTIRLDHQVNHERNLEGEYVDRQYSLVIERGGVTEVLPFRVVLKRTIHPKLKTGSWQVYSLTDPQVRAF